MRGPCNGYVMHHLYNKNLTHSYLEEIIKKGLMIMLKTDTHNRIASGVKVDEKEAF